MESTPRPMTGFPPQRLPLPIFRLAGGARGFWRLARGAEFFWRAEGDEAIVEVRGALLGPGAARLKEAATTALEAGAARLRIDLSGATRVGPGGLAALVEISQRLGVERVLVTGLRPELRLLLVRAGLHQVLEIGD